MDEQFIGESCTVRSVHLGVRLEHWARMAYEGAVQTSDESKRAGTITARSWKSCKVMTDNGRAVAESGDVLSVTFASVLDEFDAMRSPAAMMYSLKVPYPVGGTRQGLATPGSTAAEQRLWFSATPNWFSLGI